MAFLCAIFQLDWSSIFFKPMRNQLLEIQFVLAKFKALNLAIV